jgi:hypothetical protein
VHSRVHFLCERGQESFQKCASGCACMKHLWCGHAPHVPMSILHFFLHKMCDCTWKTGVHNSFGIIYKYSSSILGNTWFLFDGLFRTCIHIFPYALHKGLSLWGEIAKSNKLAQNIKKKKYICKHIYHLWSLCTRCLLLVVLCVLLLKGWAEP